MKMSAIAVVLVASCFLSIAAWILAMLADHHFERESRAEKWHEVAPVRPADGPGTPTFGPVRLWDGSSGYPAVGVTPGGQPRAILVDEEGRVSCAPSAAWPR